MDPIPLLASVARPAVSLCSRAPGGSLCFASQSSAAPRVSARRVVARAMQRQERMKDLVLIGVSVAFFALSWIYSRSFDRL